MDIKDLITSIGAATGTLLGVYNFFQAKRKERVRLTVIPQSCSVVRGGIRPSGYGQPPQYRFDSNDVLLGTPVTLAVNVINHSSFPVTVNEVGLKNPRSKNRIVCQATTIDNKPWPRRLEPREAVTVLLDLARLRKHEKLDGVTKAFASTECGTLAYGKSPALQKIIVVHLASLEHAASPRPG